MQRLLDEYRVRAIGVSNFRIGDLELLLASANVLPACNQFEIPADFSQPKVRAVCDERNT